MPSKCETPLVATTRTGLTVRAGLDAGSYPDGVKVSDEQTATLPLDRHDWHGDWNYTLHPSPAPPPHSGHPPANPSARTGRTRP